jgi:hypothetical protein
MTLRFLPRWLGVFVFLLDLTSPPVRAHLPAHSSLPPLISVDLPKAHPVTAFSKRRKLNLAFDPRGQVYYESSAPASGTTGNFLYRFDFESLSAQAAGSGLGVRAAAMWRLGSYGVLPGSSSSSLDTSHGLTLALARLLPVRGIVNSKN